MSNITITKGKVLKGDKVYVEFLKREGTESEPAECQETHKMPPHPDLTKAVSELTVHAILIGEFSNAAKLQKLEDMKQETLEQFHVSGFSVSGKDDEGVILTAQKMLRTGKTMGFNTPLVVFSDDSENAYPFMKELEIAVASCRDEFELYLGGKYKVVEDNQGKLFDEKETAA